MPWWQWFLILVAYIVIASAVADNIEDESMRPDGKTDKIAALVFGGLWPILLPLRVLYAVATKVNRWSGGR